MKGYKIINIKLYDIVYDIEESENIDCETRKAITEYLEKTRELTISLVNLGDTNMYALLDSINLDTYIEKVTGFSVKSYEYDCKTFIRKEA